MQARDYNGEELKVIILTDEEGWFAQGFEIDHDAEGESLQVVKRNFERGLGSLIERHLKSKGHLMDLLKPTPIDTWEELWNSGKNFKIAHVSLKDRESLKPLPFDGISYFEPLTFAT